MPTQCNIKLILPTYEDVTKNFHLYIMFVKKHLLGHTRKGGFLVVKKLGKIKTEDFDGVRI